MLQRLICFGQLLFLEDVVDQLQRLFAPRVAQDISALEKHGSILLKSDRHGGKLPSTNNLFHVSAHVGYQGFENTWRIVFNDRRKNCWLQFRPGQLLNRVGQLLFLEDVVNLLERLLAIRVAQDISSLEKHGSIILKFNRKSGELSSTYKFCHEVAHVGKQGFEKNRLLILLNRRKNPCLQLLPFLRQTLAGSRLGGGHGRTTAHTALVLRLRYCGGALGSTYTKCKSGIQMRSVSALSVLAV